MLKFNESKMLEHVFEKCVKEIEKKDENPGFYDAQEYKYHGNPFVRKVVVPEGVEVIAENAFHGLRFLKEIILPSSLKVIKNKAFFKCTSLSTIIIPESVQEIGQSTFWRCKKLKEVTLPSSLKEIPAYCFYKCKALKDITLPSSLFMIKASAFRFCVNLSSIIIPNSVEVIESYVFYNCHKLKNITMSNKVSVIDDGTFKDCVSLESINLPSSVNTINKDAFDSCINLKSFIASSSLTYIGSRAFAGCTNLSEINMPGIPFKICKEDSSCIEVSKSNFGNALFTGCSNIKTINNLDVKDVEFMICENEIVGCLSRHDDIVLPNLSFLDTVSDYAFLYSEFTTVRILDNIKYLNTGCFSNCTFLKSIDIPDSVESIGSYAFYKCFSLKNYNINKEFHNFKQNVFVFCDSIKGMKHIRKFGLGSYERFDIFNNTLVRYISSNEELDLSKKCFSSIKYLTPIENIFLKGVTLNEGLEEIGEEQFYELELLEKVTLPSSLKKIKYHAFESCPSLKTINVPFTTKVEQNAFIDCPLLMLNKKGRPISSVNKDNLEVQDNIIANAEHWR